MLYHIGTISITKINNILIRYRLCFFKKKIDDSQQMKLINTEVKNHLPLLEILQLSKSVSTLVS